MSTNHENETANLSRAKIAESAADPSQRARLVEVFLLLAHIGDRIRQARAEREIQAQPIGEINVDAQ